MEEKKASMTVGALRWSIATATLLALVKFVTAVLTHSMTIMASALDSVMDMATSLVNLLAARHASRPPDDSHAYGHGKIESLASLFQSLSISASGIYVVAESVRRLLRGSFVQDLYSGIAVMLFAMLITVLLMKKLEQIQRQTKSLILSTEKLHYSSDLMTNGGALLALVLIRFTGWAFIDLLFSIAIAGYIFKTSFGILRRAIDELLDRSLPPVSKEEIERLIYNFNPQIRNLHNFRSRQVGEQIFLDFHIEIQGEKSFERAHDMTEALIQRIRQDYPDADVTVHYDPEGAI